MWNRNKVDETIGKGYWILQNSGSFQYSIVLFQWFALYRNIHRILTILTFCYGKQCKFQLMIKYLEIGASGKKSQNPLCLAKLDFMPWDLRVLN